MSAARNPIRGSDLLSCRGWDPFFQALRRLLEEAEGTEAASARVIVRAAVLNLAKPNPRLGVNLSETFRMISEFWADPAPTDSQIETFRRQISGENFANDGTILAKSAIWSLLEAGNTSGNKIRPGLSDISKSDFFERIRKELNNIISGGVDSINKNESTAPIQQKPTGTQYIIKIGGEWRGFFVESFRNSESYVVEEDISLGQTGASVSGVASCVGPEGERKEIFAESVVINQIFYGQTFVQNVEEPLGRGVFVLSISRNACWLDGFTSWNSLDDDQIETSRMILVRKSDSRYESFVEEARSAMDKERKIYDAALRERRQFNPSR